MQTPVLSVVIEKVKEMPEQIAVSDPESSITYKEMERQADRLAALMLKRAPSDKLKDGCLRNQFITILLPRRKEVVVSALAIHKAGAAYVPMDTAYPDDRLQFMWDDAEAVFLITTSKEWARHKLNIPQEHILFLDKLMEEGLLDGETEYINHTHVEDEAVMLYTSGTTGKPKGVVHGHAMLIMMLLSSLRMQKLKGPNAPRPKVLCMASFCFVASQNMVTNCGLGGTLYIIDGESLMNMEMLKTLILEKGITGGFMPTILGRSMLMEYELPLNLVVLAGEQLRPFKCKGKTKVQNAYGMTESLMVCTHLVNGDEGDEMPIGKPIPGTTVFVLDEDLNPVPEGQIGELCFNSPSMAMRYHHLPEQTAQRWVQWRGMRICRTGDLVHMREDGELVCHGRKDFMIKLRGLRIEAGEVESQARALKGVTDAVCVKKTLHGQDHLCLYYTTRPGATVSDDQLRTHLATHLAEYMVPTVYMWLRAIPLNNNGKIDRLALPQPEIKLTTQCIAPKTAAEEVLLRAAQDILGFTEFGVTDNLFDLGMTSIGCVQMVKRAEENGVRCKVSDLTRCRNIRATLEYETCICSWYGEGYTPQKPVLVVVSGIITYEDLRPRLEAWSKHFSILFYEAIDEYHDVVFPEEVEGLKHVVALYHTLLDLYLPKGAVVQGMAGFSFGGELALHLADAYHQATGHQPWLLIGDTLLSYYRAIDDPAHAPQYLSEMKIDDGMMPPELIAKLNVARRFMDGSRRIGSYPGRISLLNAIQPMRKVANEAIWRHINPSVEIIDIDATHMQFCVDRPGAYLPLLTSILTKA